MKLKVQITEMGSLFHFISNLTNWHFSVRPKYREWWLYQTGELSSREQKVLNKIEKVFQKYSFGPNYWGRIFLLEPDDKVWGIAKEKISPVDLKIFKLAAKIFLSRFQKIWKKEQFILKYWKKELLEHENLLPKPLFTDLNYFFGSTPEIKTIQVILLIGGSWNNPAGGANISEGVVTLETSLVAPEFIKPVMRVFWHELTHSLWKNKKYSELLNRVNQKIVLKLFFNNISLEGVLNEAVTESLFSSGYLAKKYFNFPSEDYYKSAILQMGNNPEKNMNNWRIIAGSKLMSLSKEYIENKREIDEKYLKNIVDLLIEFLR